MIKQNPFEIFLQKKRVIVSNKDAIKIEDIQK